jgi:hypothetical protein
MLLHENPDIVPIPWTESPFLEDLLRASSLPEEQQDLVRSFARDGYLIFDPQVPDFNAVAARIIEDLEPRYPEVNRRQMDAWMFHPEVRRLAITERVLDLLRLLYRREPVPFQTLNFGVGTQQCSHSDTLHFHSFPGHYMCGVWVALEEIDADNGPLHYYPGSHRLPDYTMLDLGLPAEHDYYHHYETFVAELLKARSFEKRVLHVPKGQALIWAANLFHGGEPVRDPQRTRHSQVTHYFFRDCLYYQPMGSRLHAGKVCLREVIDIRDGRQVPHVYAGETLDIDTCENVWRHERPLPDGIGLPPSR